MAKKRLSDTAAIQYGFGDSGTTRRTSSSVEVRKISNGFVKCESSYGADGHAYTETYSENNPNVGASAPAAHGPNEHRGSLSEAIGYLKGGK